VWEKVKKRSIFQFFRNYDLRKIVHATKILVHNLFDFKEDLLDLMLDLRKKKKSPI
jgi:hypothetical protein